MGFWRGVICIWGLFRQGLLAWVDGLISVLRMLGQGPSLVVQWLGICLAMQGMQVQSLVRELNFHMPWGN